MLRRIMFVIKWYFNRVGCCCLDCQGVVVRNGCYWRIMVMIMVMKVVVMANLVDVEGDGYNFDLVFDCNLNYYVHFHPNSNSNVNAIFSSLWFPLFSSFFTSFSLIFTLDSLCLSFMFFFTLPEADMEKDSDFHIHEYWPFVLN